MNTAESIYQEAKALPEADAREVLDFLEFLKTKRARGGPVVKQEPTLTPETHTALVELMRAVTHDPHHGGSDAARGPLLMGRDLDTSVIISLYVGESGTADAQGWLAEVGEAPLLIPNSCESTGKTC